MCAKSLGRIWTIDPPINGCGWLGGELGQKWPKRD
jgi:hypothetical protein